LHSKESNLAHPALLATCLLVACHHYDPYKAYNTGSGGFEPIVPSTPLVPSTPPPAAVDAGQNGQVPPVAVNCPDPGMTAPLDVFCIGLYLNHDSKQYAPSAVPYTPGVVLWSDGAEKQRYLALPPGSKIDTSNMDVWKFPVGTKAFKEFRFNGKLVETRMVWKQGDQNTVYATYIWDENEANASLNQSTKPTVLPADFRLPDAQGYEIPDGKDCGRCHHGGADKYLGLEAIALALPEAQGVTLATLVANGSLTNPPDHTSITLPEDSTGKAAFAIGYLHANCGMPCHSGRGLGDETNLLLRLRADQFWPPADVDAGTQVAGGTTIDVTETDVYKHAVNQMPTTASVVQKFPGAVRIHPGAHDQSLLWLLPDRRDQYQMPPIVTHKVDAVGMQKIADWIDALPP
jgi:hypothetical protein